MADGVRKVTWGTHHERMLILKTWLSSKDQNMFTSPSMKSRGQSPLSIVQWVLGLEPFLVCGLTAPQLVVNQVSPLPFYAGILSGWSSHRSMCNVITARNSWMQLPCHVRKTWFPWSHSPLLALTPLLFSTPRDPWASPLGERCLFYLYECLACTYQGVPHVCLVPMEIKRGHRFPRPGVINGCVSPCRSWELNQVLCKSTKCF